MMLFQVSFTKRAAAELSRCFNGLAVRAKAGASNAASSLRNEGGHGRVSSLPDQKEHLAPMGASPPSLHGPYKPATRPEVLDCILGQTHSDMMETTIGLNRDEGWKCNNVIITIVIIVICCGHSQHNGRDLRRSAEPAKEAGSSEGAVDRSDKAPDGSGTAGRCRVSEETFLLL